MKEENNKFVIRVAGIVPMKDGFVLMHRKHVIRNKDYQEYYTFPGGHLEEFETLEEGVIREIKEEFGIHVSVIKKLYESKTTEDMLDILDNANLKLKVCNSLADAISERCKLRFDLDIKVILVDMEGNYLNDNF